MTATTAPVPVKSPTNEKDLAIIEATLSGDVNRFNDIIHSYEAAMKRIAITITGNREDAEEATQEAFLQAYENLAGFERRSSFSTWFTRIVINASLMRRRKRRQTDYEVSMELLPTEDGAEQQMDFPDHEGTPEASLDKKETRRLLYRQIDKLPEILRRVLVLRDIEELSIQKTSELLGISTTAVKSRLRRARLQLRNLVDPMLRGKQNDGN